MFSMGQDNSCGAADPTQSRGTRPRPLTDKRVGASENLSPPWGLKSLHPFPEHGHSPISAGVLATRRGQSLPWEGLPPFRVGGTLAPTG